MSPSAFVTGATGFVGRNLLLELIDAGWSVTALHRPGSAVQELRKLPVDLVVGSLDDEASLSRAIPSSVDAVFHVAGNTSVRRSDREKQTRDNVIGTRTLARVALRSGARRLIHTSSIAAFGHHAEKISEATVSNAATSPIHYVRTKWLAEKEVEKAMADGLDAVFLNPGHIIGRYDQHNWSNLFRLVASDRLPAIPPGIGSFCSVREVARAHIAAASRGRRGERYLLGGADASFREVIALIAELTGRPMRSRVAPALLLRTLGSLKELAAALTGKEPDITRDGAILVSETVLCDSRKAIDGLGYRAAPLREMFEECHRWMLEAGLLPAQFPPSH